MASKGLKIALIGCSAIIVIGIVAVGVGTYWVKKKFTEKVETVKNMAGTEDSEYGKKAAELKKDYPFTPPSNAMISENELNRFLQVRQAMFSVYKKYEPQFKDLEKKKQAGLSDIMNFGGMLNEVRMAQVKALEDQRMSPDEYTYMVTSIYKTWYAKGMKEALKGGTITGQSTDTLKQQIAMIDQQISQNNLPDEQKKALQDTRAQLQTQLDGIGQNKELQQMDAELASVPKENIDLFAKHQKEIEQYSMVGLEFLGL
jgi:hypothetical protein